MVVARQESVTLLMESNVWQHNMICFTSKENQAILLTRSSSFGFGFRYGMEYV